MKKGNSLCWAVGNIYKSLDNVILKHFKAFFFHTHEFEKQLVWMQILTIVYQSLKFKISRGVFSDLDSFISTKFI